MKTIWKFIDLCPKLKNRLIIILSITAAYHVVLLASSEILRLTIAAIEELNLDLMIRASWLALGATGLKIVLEYLNSIHQMNYTNRCEEHLQQELLSKSYSMKKERFVKIGTGNIITRMTQNVQNAVNSTLNALVAGTAGITVILFGVFYMAYLSPKLMLAIVVFHILFRIVTKIYDKKIRAIAKKISSIHNKSNSILIEILNHSLIIRLYQRQAYYIRKFAKQEEQILESEWKAFGLRNSYDELMWLTKKLAEVILLYGYGGYLVSRGELGFSVVISFTLASDYFSKGLNEWLYCMMDKNDAIPNIEAVTEYLEEPMVENELEELRLNGEDGCQIRFDHVTFGFGGSNVLEDVSFTIEAGEKVMIIGPNGQGKSTLLGLILGFYRPSSGEIYYNEHPIREVSLERLTANYCYIAQDSHVLTGTLENNIFLENTPNEEIYREVMESLHLAKVMGQDPESLSQGEKQRLSIGRALCHMDAVPLVVGDEIFSNMDLENRIDISKLIEEKCQEKTACFVCHEEMDFPFDSILQVEGGSVLYKSLRNAGEVI